MADLLVLLSCLRVGARPPQQCNSSLFPYGMCQTACPGEGSQCVSSSSSALRNSVATTISKFCLNCTNDVCTYSVPRDTLPPPTSPWGTPAGPGLRVMQRASAWNITGSRVFHTVYLPPPSNRDGGALLLPLVVEFPGNACGPGGTAQGAPSYDCGGNWTMQGWGLTEGRDAIWLTLPFITANGSENSVYWWGCCGQPGATCCGRNPWNLTRNAFTPEPTLAYAKMAIAETLKKHRGDPDKIVLIGHSRGAIATQAIGGFDDEIASLWRGQIAASHWDGTGGAYEKWPFTNASAMGGGDGDGDGDAEKKGGGPISRARRLAKVPKFLVGECDLQINFAYNWLKDVANVSVANVRAMSTGFRDHTGFWIARPSPTHARSEVRKWWRKLVGLPSLAVQLEQQQQQQQQQQRELVGLPPRCHRIDDQGDLLVRLGSDANSYILRFAKSAGGCLASITDIDGDVLLAPLTISLNSGAALPCARSANITVISSNSTFVAATAISTVADLQLRVRIGKFGAVIEVRAQAKAANTQQHDVATAEVVADTNVARFGADSFRFYVDGESVAQLRDGEASARIVHVSNWALSVGCNSSSSSSIGCSSVSASSTSLASRLGVVSSSARNNGSVALLSLNFETLI